MNETTTKATVAQRMRVLQKDISETTSATLPKKNRESRFLLSHLISLILVDLNLSF